MHCARLADSICIARRHGRTCSSFSCLRYVPDSPRNSSSFTVLSLAITRAINPHRGPSLKSYPSCGFRPAKVDHG